MNSRFKNLSATTKIVALFFIAISAVSARAQTEEPKNVPREITSFVRRAAKKENASPLISGLIKGDVDGDGDEDAVVDYAIEGLGGGGNNALLYIAVFLNNKGKYVFKAQTEAGQFGTASGEQVSTEKIANGKIICEVAAFADDDGACCPSLKSKRNYQLVGNRLKAVK